MNLFNRPKETPDPADATATAEYVGPKGGADEAKALDLVDTRFRYARDAKLYMLETWATSLAFYVGDQWRQWDDKTRKLVKRDRIPAWRVLPVYNQIPGVIDTAAAKLGRVRQLPRCRPDEQEDPEDQERARKGTQAVRGWWHTAGMEQHEHEANVQRILFGASFPHLYWDPSAPAKVAVPDPMTGKVSAQYAPVGQLCCEVLTVWDVFPEPVERWQDVSWVIVARRKPLRWFRDTFGEKAATVQPEATATEDMFSTILPGLDGQAGQQPVQAPDGDGMATLKILYERPTKGYPQGRTIYVAGGVVLLDKPRLPLPFRGLETRNPLPVKILAYRYVPKRLWPKGLVEECISPQRELNRGLGNLAEVFRLFRSPKRYVDTRWNIRKGAVTSQPDEVVEGTFNGANPTQFIEQPPNLPAWSGNYATIQREELRQVAGQHEVSEGMVPSGVSAASAIALLQGAENVRLSSPALLGKVGLEDLAAHALVVQAERYREPRMMTVPGRGGSQETAVVQGQEIGPLEVVVELAEGVEDNDAVRQQQVNDWLSAGLFELPMPLQTAILRDTGQAWLADAIEQALPEIQEQAQAQADQAAALGEQQQAGMMAQQQAQLQAQQQGQQEQAQQQAEIQEGQAQNDHRRALELSLVNAAANALVRPPTAGGK